MTATALCDVRDIPDIAFDTRYLAAWSLAAALGFLLFALARRQAGRDGAGGHGWSARGWSAAGFAVMSVPVWMVLLQVAPDLVRTWCVEGNIGAVVGSYKPPQPYSHAQLSYAFTDSILRNLGYVTLGGLLVVQGRMPGLWRRPTVTGIAVGLRGLLPMGRGEGASMAAGMAWFPVLTVGNLALLAITGTPIQSAGRGPLYAAMTPYHAVLLALAAGVGEELVFRGVMQQGLLVAQRRIAPGVPPLAAAAAATLLVAIPFAFSHASYGNTPLFLFALLFSVIASVAAIWLGIWAAIALHALIDFYAFFISVPQPGALFWFVAATVAAGVLVVEVLQARDVARRLRQPPAST